jgi:hypothetical protein
MKNFITSSLKSHLDSLSWYFENPHQKLRSVFAEVFIACFTAKMDRFAINNHLVRLAQWQEGMAAGVFHQILCY